MARKLDPLLVYNQKRDFNRTAEPVGKHASSEHADIFMVQKHHATRLHWDLRLEADGVLKSWAVTKGPSSDPDVKRLAVRTEDHPLSYASFEGGIPKKEYGGGTVMLWDRGTWEPINGKSAKDIDKGHLHFKLHGERMKGEWLLVRMKPRGKETRENWLLRKLQDEFAQEGDKLVEHELTSIATGRSMTEIAADQDGKFPLEGNKGADFAEQLTKGLNNNKTKVKPPVKNKTSQKLPAFREPQLAILVDAVPGGNSWMHEIKFDGYRAIIAALGNDVRVYTRSGKDWTDKFEPLVTVIKKLDLPSCLIDGEITAPGKDGNPEFSSLQAVLKHGQGKQAPNDTLNYHAFDLLELEGMDLAGLPNIERKERLEALLANASAPVHVADHVIGAGEKLYRAMCDAGQEGIISKKIDGKYRSTRSKAWVKVKCTLRQEFVIVGWSESKARGRPFASLVLGQHEDGRLLYKGKVGTGFDGEQMDSLAAAMKQLARKTAPVEADTAQKRGVHWITPKLVVEIAFAEFTADGNARHASFLGLRNDKDADEVTPEKPDVARKVECGVQISSRDRVIFPDSGQTKGQLADYYAAIAPLMLPFANQRPISLVRCPQGRAKKCFFQKHDSGSFGDGIHHVPITDKDGETEDYLYVKDKSGVLQCVQMGSIEFHGWGSRSADVEAPDRMIFDLDPDEGLDFNDVKRAATDIRDQLADLGLISFAMLSGGKGVHVVVPLTPGHDWDTHKDFARRFSKALALSEADRFTASISKAKRKGKIFIDWLRNQRGATAVLPYSARARRNAPVAVPIAWSELSSMKDARPFSIDDVNHLLLRAQAQSLKGWGLVQQKLPDV